MIKFQELESNRLLFKKFNYEDYVKVWSVDYRYYFNLPGLFIQDKEIPLNTWDDLKKYNENNIYEDYQLKSNNEIDWLVYLKDTNEVIGTIMTSYDDTFKNCTNFGYMFLRKYWGKGYAFEASKIVMEYIFSCNINEIKARISFSNNNSIKLIKKLGFELEMIKTDQCLFYDGEKEILGDEYLYHKHK